MGSVTIREDGFAATINLIGRILLAVFFIYAACSKLFNWEEAVLYMAKDSVPEAFLPLTIAFELLCGCALLLGWRTQLAALLLALFTVLTTLIFYSDLSGVMGVATFSKNMALAGGLFTLASQYPGMWSLDRLRLDPDQI